MADARYEYRDTRYTAPRQHMALSRTAHESSSEDEMGQPGSRYESHRSRPRATRTHRQDNFEVSSRARTGSSSSESDDDPGPSRFRHQRLPSPARVPRRHEEIRAVRRDPRWDEDPERVPGSPRPREPERRPAPSRGKPAERPPAKDRGVRRRRDSHLMDSSDELVFRESDEEVQSPRDFRHVEGGPPPVIPSSVSAHSRLDDAADLDRRPERSTRPPPAPSAPIEIRRRSTTTRDVPYRSSPLSRGGSGVGENQLASSPSKNEGQIPITGSPGSFSQKVGTPVELQGSWSAPASSVRTSVIADRHYQYKPLEDSYIRLVRILPERKTMLRCELVHVPLRKVPRYFAISYAWGDAGDTRKIELEGSLVRISLSLHGALNALRQKSESVLVWADALSIDQQNAEERTQQIQMMGSIFASAASVAVWLGPEKDDSTEAIGLLFELASHGSSSTKLGDISSSATTRRALLAVVPLFEREYWRRLWVIQEIFNAQDITVYCGPTKVSWGVYREASSIFRAERHLLDRQIRTEKHGSLTEQSTPTQILVSNGPASLPNLEHIIEREKEPLLDVLRACRRKLSSDPKDKLFGVLGMLPERVRSEFRPDYSLSLRDIYTEIVDYVLKTTENVDVICDAVHFPAHTSLATLPSFVPDWSHIPQVASLSHWNAYGFQASGDTKAVCRFLDERLNRLEISAIHLGKVKVRGVAVGTMCTSDDYVMAFLQWRALLLQSIKNESDKAKLLAEQQFTKALCLGQVPEPWDRPNRWLEVCYHVFASTLRLTLPYLPLDDLLMESLDAEVDIPPEDRESFLDSHFGSRMMGRCFLRTEEGRIGMGTGFMAPGDIVVVPLGCSTPILLRETGVRGEYLFVGDVYIHGYMDGKAVQKWKNGDAELKKYVLV